ncbi:glycosyl hydrolase family 18 protein [Arcticibacter sp.]|uniref:glycosyl hydrolase family 18 protein n=1 Tax=Arcticibacter sp. TaxID=1872630 RepID=UPI003890E346
MRTIGTLILLLCIFTAIVEGVPLQSADPDFRIVGYYKGDLKNYHGKIDFSRITHLNIAFINPDERGVFHPVPGLTALVARAHQHNVKVLAAIGGGKAPEYYSNLISQQQSTAFVKSIRGMMDNYGLDGIDVDLEGSLITADYANFIRKLSRAIKPSGLLTVAVASNNASKLDSATLSEFDFVNIMSYDKTGPWRPNDAGQHAPYTMAVEDLVFWKSKGLSRRKLNLGLPFYGYGFNSSISSMSYSKIINTYPGADRKDELKLDDGGMLYYNGIPLIQRKTTLALEEAGGVMVWQLAQDTVGKKSLLYNIKHVIQNYRP